jgi:hypothetical protein
MERDSSPCSKMSWPSSKVIGLRCGKIASWKSVETCVKIGSRSIALLSSTTRTTFAWTRREAGSRARAPLSTSG